MSNTHLTIPTEIFKDEFVYENGKYYFIKAEESLITDDLDKIKYSFKKYPILYQFLIDIISPVYTNKDSLRKFLNSQNGLIVNLGSGNTVLFENIINLDIINYKNVHIIADINNLPFKDGSVDAIITIAVLEHVNDINHTVEEIYRVLKSGGKVYNLIPFMQPFHASPHDYQRYTLNGIKNLHKKFAINEAGVAGGPTSGLLWVFQDYISTIFSFGNQKIKNFILIFLLILLWPVKFLDLIFTKNKYVHSCASSFYVIATKSF